MKKKNLLQRIRSSYTGIAILFIVSVCAGLGLMITPDNTPKIVIQGLGFIWVLEGLGFLLDLINKYYKDRIENRKNL